MQRTISALALATVMTIAVGGCSRPSAEPVSQAPAADNHVRATERAPTRVSTPEAVPAEAAPKTPVEPVYSVVSPLGDPIVKMIAMAPRLDTLAGKTACMIWNHSFRADITFPAIEESLKKNYPDIKIIPYEEIDAAIRAAGPQDASAEAATLQIVLREKGCGAVISGNGG